MLKMAHCEFCGQELKGVRFEKGDIVLASTGTGLKEAKITKVLPSGRYRIVKCDSISIWDDCYGGFWEEKDLFKTEEEYITHKEACATLAMEKILEEIDQMHVELKAGTLVKARFATQIKMPPTQYLGPGSNVKEHVKEYRNDI
jgi:hypothetical protein